MDNPTSPNQSPPNNHVNSLVSRALNNLKKGYSLVDKTQIHVFHAWLVIGMAIGISSTFILVANRSGEFQRGKAQGGNIIIGPQVTVLPNSITGTYFFPDGHMSVQKTGSLYRFTGAGVSGAIASPLDAIGTLNNPVSQQEPIANPIQGLKEDYDYAAGGPIYKDASTGIWIMVYHGEKWPQGDPTRFVPFTNLAKSTDNGNTWTDLGMILSSFPPYDPNCQVDCGGTGAAPFILKNEVDGQYMYLYHNDTTASFAVSRAKISDIVSEAVQGRAALFTKYYNGSFSQPGLEGLSDPIFGGTSLISAFYDVSYNSSLGKYIIVAPILDAQGFNLYFMESEDGINWVLSQAITSGTPEHFYVTITDDNGNDSRTTGQTFYIYYTYSIIGAWQRWEDAVLARRLITIDGVPPPPPPSPSCPSGSNYDPGTYGISCTLGSCWTASCRPDFADESVHGFPGWWGQCPIEDSIQLPGSSC